METNEIREAVCDFLGILQHKAKTGRLTTQDLQAINEIMMAGGVHATVEDLAGYYGQSPDNIRHVIHRNILPAPERRFSMTSPPFGSGFLPAGRKSAVENERFTG